MTKLPEAVTIPIRERRSVSSASVLVRGNLRMSGRYGGPAGFSYLDFVFHWMEDAIRRNDPDRAYREARCLARFLIPINDEIHGGKP